VKRTTANYGILNPESRDLVDAPGDRVEISIREASSARERACARRGDDRVGVQRGAVASSSGEDWRIARSARRGRAGARERPRQDVGASDVAQAKREYGRQTEARRDLGQATAGRSFY